MMLAKGIPLIVLLSMQYLNTRYKWGGQDFTGLDCSGLVVLVLRELGVIKTNSDYTAQGLYNLLLTHELTLPLSHKQSGSILFYGKSTKEITHVDICIDPGEGVTIGASGGDSTTNTLEDAIKRDSRVKISKIRKDLVASLTLEL